MSAVSALPLTALCDLVWQATDAVMAVYARSFDVQTKADQSPLTEADVKSHDLLTAGLARLTPEIPVLSEESGDIPWQTRRGWSRYWLVDPLDGTKEFIARNGEFTINLALVEGHEATLGVVAVPAQERLYVGAKTPALCYLLERSGARVDLQVKPMARPADSPSRPVVVVASRSHRHERLKTLLEQLEQRLPEIEIRSIGSALKLCLLAQGEADLYPRLAPTSEWDTAAAHAVLTAAGGEIFTLAGEPVRYNTKDSLLNPFFIAAADRQYPWREVLGEFGADG